MYEPADQRRKGIQGNPADEDGDYLIQQQSNFKHVLFEKLWYIHTVTYKRQLYVQRWKRVTENGDTRIRPTS